MKQGVRASDIDERAVIGQAADLALHRIALFEFRETALLAGAFFVFRYGAAIDHHVFLSHVEFDNAAADFLFDELLHFGRVAGPAARSGHEGSHSYIHAQAALDHARHGANDRRLLGEGLLQRCPVGWTLDFAASQFIITFRIAPLDS